MIPHSFSGNAFVPHRFKLWVLMAICLSMSATADAQEWLGFPFENILVGEEPQEVATGDFNDDGIMDLVTANAGSFPALGEISVLLGNGSGGMGDGTFATAISYTAGTAPSSVATGDLNGDEITDLVAANFESDDVSILLGNGNNGIGDGTFAEAVTYAAGDAPSSVALDDFDRDGFLDIVVANGFSDDLSVLINNGGDGTFTDQVTYDAENSTQSVTTGDFNGDGITDLAATNASVNTISVLLGNASDGTADGTFSPQVSYLAGISPRSVVTGDFNSDGITDLATANDGASSTFLDGVSILLGDGSGGVGDRTFADAVNYDAGDLPWDLAVGDFNGDGISDLAVANRNSSDFSVLLGNGNGSMGDGTFATAVSYPAGDTPIDVTTGDFNSDGVTDLAIANNFSRNLSVRLGNQSASSPGEGDGTFAAPLALSAERIAIDVAVGDFDGDGQMDIAAANRGSSSVSIFLSSGAQDGLFAPQASFDVGAFPWGMTTGDFNGDGILDLATANRSSDDVSILLGDGSNGMGDGTFSVPATYSAGETPENVITGDFNGDGIADLATANGTTVDEVTVLLGNGSNGTGDGTFGSPSGFSTDDAPVNLTTADFNGDDILDLATANFLSDNVTVLLGIGNGTFGSATAYEAGDGVRDVTAGDFNGDGILDLASANEFSGDLSIFLGDGGGGIGDGTFADQIVITLPSSPWNLTTEDFNRDGVTDVAFTNPGSASVSILLGSTSAFFDPIHLEGGIGPQGVTAADFNGDGNPDLATANSGIDPDFGQVTVVLNLGFEQVTLTGNGYLLY